MLNNVYRKSLTQQACSISHNASWVCYTSLEFYGTAAEGGICI